MPKVTAPAPVQQGRPKLFCDLCLDAMVYLTVDVEQDCPPFMTSTRGMEAGMPLLLALLEEERVPATFFATGDMARRFPRTIETIVERHHELGCHGLSHTRFTRMDHATARMEIETAAQILRGFGAVTSFRAPNLDFPPEYLPLLEAAGFTLDSSAARYKVQHKYRERRSRVTAGSLVRVPATTTPSFLRLPAWLRDPWLGRLRDPIVLFIHPWEFVDVRHERLPLDCRFNTGELALVRLREVLRYYRDRGDQFGRMNELVPANHRAGRPVTA